MGSSSDFIILFQEEHNANNQSIGQAGKRKAYIEVQSSDYGRVPSKKRSMLVRYDNFAKKA
jgi:hypothetical protein